MCNFFTPTTRRCCHDFRLYMPWIGVQPSSKCNLFKLQARRNPCWVSLSKSCQHALCLCGWTLVHTFGEGCVNGNLPLAQILAPGSFPKHVLKQLMTAENHQALRLATQPAQPHSSWVAPPGCISVPENLCILGWRRCSVWPPNRSSMLRFCSMLCICIIYFYVYSHEWHWHGDSTLTLKEDIESFATLVTLKQSSTTPTLHTTIHGHPNRLRRLMHLPWLQQSLHPSSIQLVTETTWNWRLKVVPQKKFAESLRVSWANNCQFFTLTTE